MAISFPDYIRKVDADKAFSELDEQARRETLPEFFRRWWQVARGVMK